MPANPEALLLMASSQRDMEDWVQAIRRVIWAPLGGGTARRSHAHPLEPLPSGNLAPLPSSAPSLQRPLLHRACRLCPEQPPAGRPVWSSAASRQESHLPCTRGGSSRGHQGSISKHALLQQEYFGGCIPASLRAGPCWTAGVHAAVCTRPGAHPPAVLPAAM